MTSYQAVRAPNAMRHGLLLMVCLAALALFGRATADAPSLRSPPLGPPPLPRDVLPVELPLDRLPLGLPAAPPSPANNELTPERMHLGRKLFFDPALSADGTVSCASCHDPAHGFASPAPRAVGIRGKVGTRNAPSLLNVAFGDSFFWDGRTATLEAQALEPIVNPLEMGSQLSDVVARLVVDERYPAAFQAAYGEPVTPESIGRALASFERVLLSGGSRVDRFQEGDLTALNESERIGLWLFESRAQCWRCHRGPRFTDGKFHNTGVASLQAEPDAGRMSFTHDEADRHRFKTPGLRGVSRTAPYMHDGSLATLRDVVDYYNRGGGEAPGLDPALRPLKLSPAEIDHLVDFLNALDGDELKHDGE